jgi:thiol-disulfide isomerase/thioredoxin
MGMDRAFIHMAVSTYGQGRAWWTDSSTISNMCKNAYERWPTTIGQPAPELELKNIKGEWYRTQSTKAPWTIMIFWDPTCGHCKEVMPKLAKIYENNKSRGWKVIGLSSGDKRKEWEEYYNSHPETQSFIHLIRGEVLTERYKQNLFTYFVKSSPTIYILDENNVIQANRIDIDKLEDFINHLERERYPHLVPTSVKTEPAPTKSTTSNTSGKSNAKPNNKPAKSAGKK